MRYEAIFRALGTPHAMDILFLLYSHTSALSQEGLARRLNLSPGALTQPLAALVSLDLVNVIEIESEQGVSRCYQSVGSSIIMALYFIRESLAEKHINLASFYTRTKPLLAEPGAGDYAPPSGNARKKQPGFVFKEKNKSGLFHTSLPPFCTTVIFCYSVDSRKILMILDLVTAILALAYVALFQTLHLVFLTLFILWVLNAITASSRHLLPNLSYCRYARSGV